MTHKSGTADSAPRPEPRSYLYVPGDAERKLERVLERGADAIIIDLEDGVAPQAKDRARRSAQEWLNNLPATAKRDVAVLVRINHWPAGEADLEVAVCPAVNGICLPKAATSELVELNAALERAEAAAGLSRGSLSVQPLVESARAVLEATALAAGPRVERLQLGELDLAADLGAEPGPDGSELLLARSQVVLASAAAGIGAPVGPVEPDLHDTELFVRTTVALRRMGFGSRACAHPAQVELANQIFTPTPAELERAEAVLAAYDAALKAGLGAVAGPEGHLVDEAPARLARRVIARARAR